jgi:membrane associated rhomboid family serine protease
MLSLTIIIIILTAVISFIAFSNQKLVNDLIFYVKPIRDKNEWFRFVSCGFIHADIGHLAFNMISLYMFGELVEDQFAIFFGSSNKLIYIIFYITALIICLIPTYIKNRNNDYYRSLGASGAVSAIVFAGIFLYPTAKIGIFIIPPIIPGFIFAPIYLFISAMLSKKGGNNINHSAHIWGALYGVVFLIVTTISLSHVDVIASFTEQVKGWFLN